MFVIVRKEVLKEEFHDLPKRVFYTQGGSGVHSGMIGTGVFGIYVFDGECTKIDRYSCERIASYDEVMEAVKLNPDGILQDESGNKNRGKKTWTDLDIKSKTMEYKKRFMAINFEWNNRKNQSIVLLNIDPRDDDQMWNDIDKIFEDHKQSSDEYNYNEGLDKIIDYFKEKDYFVEVDDRYWDFDADE